MVNWLYRKRYMFIRCVLQMFRSGLLMVFLVMSCVSFIYVTCLAGKCSEEFIKEFLMNFFAGVNLFYFPAMCLVFFLYLFCMMVSKNLVIMVQRCMGLIGASGGIIYIGALESEFVDIASGGGYDKTFMTVFWMLVLVHLLRYLVNRLEEA